MTEMRDIYIFYEANETNGTKQAKGGKGETRRWKESSIPISEKESLHHEASIELMKSSILLLSLDFVARKRDWFVFIDHLFLLKGNKD